MLSIKAGTISSAQLLRRLGSYSRRNRLYQAFRELGRVVRTVFLLEYLSDAQLREHITATTNKVETYNGFAKWLNFGGEGVIETLVAGVANNADPLQLIADLAGTLADAMERLGVATAAEVGLETLAERMISEAAATRSVILGRFEIAAWSRV